METWAPIAQELSALVGRVMGISPEDLAANELQVHLAHELDKLFHVDMDDLISAHSLVTPDIMAPLQSKRQELLALLLVATRMTR